MEKTIIVEKNFRDDVKAYNSLYNIMDKWLKKNAIPTKANRNLRFINGVIVLEAFPRTGNRKAEKVFYAMPECIRLKIGENTENGKKEKVIQATFDGVRFAEIMGYEIVVKE